MIVVQSDEYFLVKSHGKVKMYYVDGLGVLHKHAEWKRVEE